MSATAKLFMHGRSQAVRLPKEFRSRAARYASARSATGDLEPLKSSLSMRRRGSRVSMSSAGAISSPRACR